MCGRVCEPQMHTLKVPLSCCLTQIVSNEISEKEAIAEDTQREIDAARVGYKSCGAYNAVLFFSIRDMVRKQGGRMGCMCCMGLQGSHRHELHRLQGCMGYLVCMGGLNLPDALQ